jgi:hypothetical protein
MSGIPSWARRAIRRVRPHRPQGRFGRSAQRAQNGRFCSSRPAIGLTTPQLVQGTASCRRRQRAQTPPDGDRVNGFPVRPHRVQAGSGRSASRALSSPTSLPITGGAPTSNAAGSAVNAAARWRVIAGLVSTASTASASTTAGRPGTAAVTAVMIWARRHRVQNRPGGQAWQPFSVGGTGQFPAPGSTRARVGRGGAVPAAARRGACPRFAR